MHLLLCAALLGQVKDEVFDLKAILAPPLHTQVLKSTEKDGIVTEEVKFFSEMDGEKKIEIFALFCYPRGGKNLPAFIWNQGGLSQATPHFPLIGAKRGYAALCIDFPIPGYRSTGGYPINSGLELTPDPRKAPIYHGAVALLRAVSFLQSRPEVDGERIGMAGSSWGGFYTTLMVGIDPRLKVGSSMFGSGSLQLGNSWWDGGGRDPKRDDAFRKRWSTTLDPAFRLSQAKTPIAWFTGTNDLFYWLPAVIDSHRQAAGPKHLALLPNFDHALTPDLDEQVFAWLDIHLKEAPPFLAIKDFKIETKPRNLVWTIEGKRKPKLAEVCVSFGPPGNWRGRYWMTIPAKIDGATCRAVVPPSRQPVLVYANVVDEQGFRTSTPLMTIDADAGAKQEVPTYNGVAMWSPLSDKERLSYLQMHGLPIPKLDKDGTAIYPGGKHGLGPVYFTAGVKHRLTFEYSTDTTPVALALTGVFDGKPLKEETTLKSSGENWEKESLAFTPRQAEAASLRIEINVAAKGTLRLKKVRFEPVD